jgi:protease-4
MWRGGERSGGFAQGGWRRCGAGVPKMVDKIGNWADFGQRVADLAGEDKGDKRPGAFAHTSLATWIAANPESSDGKAIGVVTVAAR